MFFWAEEKSGMRRRHADLAIQLAMRGRWSDAVNLNRALVAEFPGDIDGHNRLGRALAELGRYEEARQAYGQALQLDPHNAIARKNIARLDALQPNEVIPRESGRKLPPRMFIEEMGKTGITTLVRPEMAVAGRMTAGDQLLLREKRGVLFVESAHGECVGEVEPKLGRRLIRFMEGGNEYVAAIASVTDGSVRLLIRETLRHPTQAGKLSFPPAAADSFRPFVRKGSSRRDEDELFLGESEDEWESGAPGGGSSVTAIRHPSDASKGMGEEETEESDRFLTSSPF